MKTGVLIVGLGQIGMGYDLELDPSLYVFSHARAFAEHPAFQLMAAVDPDANRREIFTNTYRCPAYPDIESALALHQPDLVVIATPTPMHGETLQAVLRRSSPKLILCEKPLSYDAEEGRAMVEACAEKGVSLHVNYFRRSVPGVIEIKRRLGSGAISTPVKGVVWYSKGFLHNGSHFFNLLEYWLGPMQGAVVLNTGRLRDAIDPEPDVQVKFANGEAIFLAAWEEKFSHHSVELLAQNGRLRYERGGESIAWQAVASDDVLNDYRVLSGQEQAIESGMSRYQWHVVDQLARSLAGDSSELCSGNAALATLRSMRSIVALTLANQGSGPLPNDQS